MTGPFTENRFNIMDHVAKWDKASKCYDWVNAGVERRYGRFKRDLFEKCQGKTLLVAAGTGLDFQFFPAGLDVTAIDFSPKMVKKAKKKAVSYEGKLKVILADVQALELPEGSFDTVVTSCTFCSVPNPVKGLKELYRVLKSDGQLFMFEHVRPGNFLLGIMVDILTPVARKFGPELNRRTGENIKKAGFKITREFNIYLDMVKLFEASK